jgi:NitT/TauT family transport system substrate-binding protein
VYAPKSFINIVDKKVDNRHGAISVAAGWGKMQRLLAIIWAAVSLCVGFGNVAARAQTPTRISVGYTNSVSFIGLFIAQDQGMFAKRGLDVTPVLIALNSTIPSALVGGSIQIGGTTPPVLLQAVEGGLDVVVIAGGAVNDVRNTDGAGVVARIGTGIKSPRDFEGRRVGVPGLGAYMHVMFRRWLTEHGADYKKVNFVEVPLAQAGDILKSGNVDAVLVGEPFYSRIVRARTGYLVAPYFVEMPDSLFAIYYSSNTDWAKRNPAAIKAFREALAEASAYLAAKPALSRQILGRATRLPPDVVESVVLPTLKLTVPPSDLRWWAETLQSQGMIKAMPNTDRLVIN